MPTALRIPQAKTFFSDPSGLNSKMRARSDSDESSELFERDPMETYILLPSGAKTMSRVQCPPPRSKAHHAICVCYIKKLRVISRRVKGDAKWVIQAGICKLFRPDPAAFIAKNFDFIVAAFGDK